MSDQTWSGLPDDQGDGQEEEDIDPKTLTMPDLTPIGGGEVPAGGAAGRTQALKCHTMMGDILTLIMADFLSAQMELIVTQTRRELQGE